MSGGSYDEQIASIDAQIEKLRARRRDEVARREASERKAYNHAVHALGEMVIGASGVDWQCLDYPLLYGTLRTALSAPGARVATRDGITTREATRRLREWERTKASGQDEERGQCR